MPLVLETLTSSTRHLIAGSWSLRMMMSLPLSPHSVIKSSIFLAANVPLDPFAGTTMPFFILVCFSVITSIVSFRPCASPGKQ